MAEYVDCRPSEPPAMNGNHENSSEPVNMRNPKTGAGHKNEEGCRRWKAGWSSKG